MRPLTLDDLLPLEEFAGRRRELFAAHARYLDQYRRVRVGPRLTLLFENRQTLWFRVQELLRVARLADPRRRQQELDVYNRLLPGRDRLQAALLVAVADETRLTEELAPWRALGSDTLALVLGEVCQPAEVVTRRPEDFGVGAAHWVQFPVPALARRLLANVRVPARLQINLPDYRYDAPLGEDVRQSLLDDLDLSDRDGRAA
jgi:hypothetical protein